ncbi:MFS family permease [Actinoalloteichus hoggarensis]|uniref:Putative MFS family transporter protein n=1 Tax=Actinoalloteichus hoggarensis TaxID=1470176 RepID=A0A221W2X5_9PSEU|nr:MFS transporter [Actinoalloteichus hoggarensis]ASO20180.1 putative MFS family transporter protein [Actinoalloteichus hoggarensis]MBB5919107.1 MFS family permease [Actinoalloteichus hoggarensis]
MSAQATPGPRAPVTLRSLIPAVFLPATLYGLGQGAAAPLIAITARELGASFSLAGVIVAVLSVGQVVGNLPAGRLVGVLGERGALLAASVLAVLAAVGCALASNLPTLAASVLVAGLANSVWGLARQTFLTEVVPLRLRARAMSTLGGVVRIGSFAGPLIGAGALLLLGPRGGYWVQVLAILAAGTIVLVLPDVERRRTRAGAGAPARPLRMFVEHRRLFATLGTSAVLVGAIRASRQVVVPLWGDHLGLDPAVTSLIYGVSGALDMLLFYPAGRVMDLYGRRFVAVPSMLVLGVSCLLLPLAGGPVSLLLVAALMGVGNGMGSGIMMTLGADLAPPDRRPAFLAAWRLCVDTGGSTGPLLIGAGAALSLGFAIAGMGVIGLLAAAGLGRWIVEPDRADLAAGGRGRVAGADLPVGGPAIVLSRDESGRTRQAVPSAVSGPKQPDGGSR